MPCPERMEAAVHAYVDAFARSDADAVALLFAEDATVEDPVGSPPHVGRDAIRAFYGASMGTGAKLELHGPVRIAGPYAAFAFSVLLHFQGKDQRVDVIDTFRFDEDDKIVEMKAYFGPTNMHGFA